MGRGLPGAVRALSSSAAGELSPRLMTSWGGLVGASTGLLGAGLLGTGPLGAGLLGTGTAL